LGSLSATECSRGDETKLLNLGNPGAGGWLAEHVSRLLTDQGIDLYHDNFNIDSLGYWDDNNNLNR